MIDYGFDLVSGAVNVHGLYGAELFKM